MDVKAVFIGITVMIIGWLAPKLPDDYIRGYPNPLAIKFYRTLTPWLRWVFVILGFIVVVTRLANLIA